MCDFNSVWVTKTAEMQQKQEAERYIAVCPRALLQLTVWKYFSRADKDLFEQLFSIHAMLNKKIFGI